MISGQIESFPFQVVATINWVSVWVFI